MVRITLLSVVVLAGSLVPAVSPARLGALVRSSLRLEVTPYSMGRATTPSGGPDEPRPFFGTVGGGTSGSAFPLA